MKPYAFELIFVLDFLFYIKCFFQVHYFLFMIFISLLPLPKINEAKGIHIDISIKILHHEQVQLSNSNNIRELSKEKLDP